MPFIEIVPYVVVGGAMLVAVASILRGSGGAGGTFTFTWSSAPGTVTPHPADDLRALLVAG